MSLGRGLAGRGRAVAVGLALLGAAGWSSRPAIHGSPHGQLAGHPVMDRADERIRARGERGDEELI
jgi:hypothetical protein